MRTKFKITIDNLTTNVIINNDVDYAGGEHNYDGIRGAAIDRAVKKLYGCNDYWYGDYSNLLYGQVFRPVKIGTGSTNVTSKVCVDVEVLNAAYK